MESSLLVFVFMNVRAENLFHIIEWMGRKVPLLLYSFKVFIRRTTEGTKISFNDISY